MLPEAQRGQGCEGLTTAEMQKCRWLKLRLVATIVCLEWTGTNQLRHSKFAGVTAIRRLELYRAGPRHRRNIALTKAGAAW
jgi:hypothetical protein